MHFIHPDSTLLPMLQNMVGPELVYHLFMSDTTPDLDSVLADFTESQQPQYTPKSVLLADFIFSGVAAHRGTILAAPITWNLGGGTEQLIYGYYVTDTGGTILRGVARFPSPINANGAEISVTPSFSLNSRFAS